MTRIGNADQVLLLLQDQLERLRRTRSGPSAGAAPAATPAPLDRARALAARAGISEDDGKRALVRGLLVQQLGEAIGNDPAFASMAADVARIIGESDDGAALLDRALAVLTGTPS